MKIALISDIHANLEALEAVLGDIKTQGVDRIVCLGDVVGYGPDPVACLELVEKSCDTRLMGNHEYGILGLLPLDSLNQYARHSIDWTTERLTDREIAMIAEYDLETDCEGCHLVHSSPFEPDHWHYILSSQDAELGFDNTERQITFFGHTHLPMVFSRGADGSVRSQAGHSFDPDKENRYLINVGSVGQPRDNDPRSCYVIYDASEESVSYRRVQYDVKSAQCKMAVAELPGMLIERLAVGR